MKPLITIFLSLFASIAFCQDLMYEEADKKERQLDEAVFASLTPLPLDEKKAIVFQEVVTIPGKTKDQIYTEARAWFAKTFNSATAVIQMDDKQGGTLIGRGVYLSVVPIDPEDMYKKQVKVDMRFLLSIEIKDGKYRYTVSDLQLRDPYDSYSRYTPAEHQIMDLFLFRKKGKFNRDNLYTRKGVQVAIAGMISSLTSSITSAQQSADW